MEKKIAAIADIKSARRVTAELKKMYFPGWSFGKIRNWLEENGLDRHMTLELCSTEIAIRTPFGILMQIRPTDHDQLGMWGGVLNDDEEPIDGAVRELQEETGIKVEPEQLVLVEENVHDHEYANGDKASFKSYRFKLDLDYVPKVTTDEESVGAVMVAHIILDHQQEFIGRMLEDLPTAK